MRTVISPTEQDARILSEQVSQINQLPQPDTYLNRIVRKPWGHEFAVYVGKRAAVWVLHLREGESTSLHCHPGKTTVLVPLIGEMRLETLGSVINAAPLDRLEVQPGAFHRILADTDIYLLEIEDSPNKLDLVRVKDSYYRVGMGYESAETAIVERDELAKFGHFCFDGQDVSGVIGDKIVTLSECLKSDDSFLLRTDLYLTIETGTARPLPQYTPSYISGNPSPEVSRHISVNSDLKFLYFGEFGFFNIAVIGFIERLLTRDLTISIVTLSDYAKILRSYFDSSRLTIFERQDFPTARVGYKCFDGSKHWSILDASGDCIEVLNRSSFVPLDEHVVKSCFPEAITYLDDRHHYKWLRPEFPLALRESSSEESGPLVLIFPRYRENNVVQQTLRNMDIEACRELCDWMKKVSPSIRIETVGHLQEFKALDGIPHTADIESVAEKLASCTCFITPNSGYALFAANVGCKNVIFLDSGELPGYMLRYNPFETKYQAFSRIKAGRLDEVKHYLSPMIRPRTLADRVEKIAEERITITLPPQQNPGIRTKL